MDVVVDSKKLSMRVTALLLRIQKFYFQYERIISPAFFIFGFVIDNLTLTRIDFWVDLTILFTYLAIAGVGIVVVNLREAGRLRAKPFDLAAPWITVAIQYAFGGLFSGFAVFYLRSGSLAASWPFLLLIFLLVAGNEIFRERYERIGFQASVFFLTIFSFAVFFVPILTGKIGVLMFLFSGAVSLLIFSIFFTALSHFVPERVLPGKKTIMLSVGSIFVLMNFFYFTNILPPIPLSLKDVGVFHSVVRSKTGVYLVEREEKRWYQFLNSYDRVFEQYENEPAYFWTAVFAPTRISTDIVHSWLKYDYGRDRWVERTRVHFPINGGRDGGYRGWSFQNVSSGKWRVDVTTPRGQVLGRVKFEVVEVDTPPELILEDR